MVGARLKGSATKAEGEFIILAAGKEKERASYIPFRRRLTGVILTAASIQRPQVLHSNKKKTLLEAVSKEYFTIKSENCHFREDIRLKCARIFLWCISTAAQKGQVDLNLLYLWVENWKNPFCSLRARQGKVG